LGVLQISSVTLIGRRSIGMDKRFPANSSSQPGHVSP